jgi:hypothetical protein
MPGLAALDVGPVKKIATTLPLGPNCAIRLALRGLLH